jgi:hypothetical protein
MKGFNGSQSYVQNFRDLAVVKVIVVFHHKNHPLLIAQFFQAAGKNFFEIRGWIVVRGIMGGMIHLFDIFLPPQLIVFFVMFPVIIDAYVFGQLKQPILEIFSCLEHVGFLVESQKGLLHDVQSIFLVTKIGVKGILNLHCDYRSTPDFTEFSKCITKFFFKRFMAIRNASI